MNEEKLRTLKSNVEQNSIVVEQIVEQIVSKYDRELEELLADMKQALEKKNDLSNEELDRITLKLPLLMYFASSGLEILGIECDTAKAQKSAIFNQKYLLADGTIQDKTKTAENSTIQEAIIEVAFTRAYKQLRLKLDMAEHIFSGVKKVLSKRIQESNLSNMN